MTTQIEQESGTDFAIPFPEEEFPAAQGGAFPPNVPPAPENGATAVHVDTLEAIGTMTVQDWLIGGGIAIALALVFLFARRALIGNLTASFADYVRAKNAGNMLYLFLLITGVTATFGTLGNLWNQVPFTIGAGVLIAVILILFLASAISAKRSTKG